jgi:lysophospholipase L1-like esterase
MPTASGVATTPPAGGDAGGEGTGGEGAGGEGTTVSNGGASPGGTGGDVAEGGGGPGGAGAGGSGGETDAAAGQGGEGPVDGFRPCPTTGDPCAILPLGDSITEGFGSSGGGYRVELFRQAVQAGKSITFVGALANGPNDVEGQPFPRQHEGHGGYTIDSDAGHSGISGQITDSALSMYHPHIVLLMIGTNDLNGNVDVNNAPSRLGDLIDDIVEASPETLVVVATIIPMVNGNDSKVGPYNEAMVGLVDSRAAEGQHVVLLDNWAAFTADPNYANSWMGDSLHPNDAGYAVLGGSFYDAISEYLP